MPTVNKNPSQEDKLNAWQSMVGYIQETGHIPMSVCVGTDNGVYIVRPEQAIRDMLLRITELTLTQEAQCIHEFAAFEADPGYVLEVKVCNLCREVRCYSLELPSYLENEEETDDDSGETN